MPDISECIETSTSLVRSSRLQPVIGDNPATVSTKLPPSADLPLLYRSVCDLSIYTDCDLPMPTHVKHTVSRRNAFLSQIQSLDVVYHALMILVALDCRVLVGPVVYI